MAQLRVSRPLLAGAALVLTSALAGCGDDAEQPQAAPSAETTSSSPSSGPTVRSSRTSRPPDPGPMLRITVAGDTVSPMAETMTLSTGDVLTVQIQADRPGELHVHSSPEQYVDFGQGRSEQRIKLDKPGQVDVEEHDSGALVARLLVE